MKRFIFLSVILFALAGVAFAELSAAHFKIPASEKEFSVNFIELNGMKKTKFPKQEDMHVTRAYKVKNRGYEGVMTYSLFADDGVSKEAEKARTEVYVWTAMCILNVTGLAPDSLPNITPFADEDVRGEFNGDCGFTCFLLDKQFKNNFLKGYSVAAVDTFYKKGQGLVVRVSMSNDVGFFGLSEKFGSFTMEAPYFDFYDSFKFRGNEEKAHFAVPKAKENGSSSSEIACSSGNRQRSFKAIANARSVAGGQTDICATSVAIRGL